MSSDTSAFLPGIADGAGLPHSASIAGAARPGLAISSAATQTDNGALHGKQTTPISATLGGMGCLAMTVAAVAGRKAMKAHRLRRAQTARRFWQVQVDLPIPGPEDVQAVVKFVEANVKVPTALPSITLPNGMEGVTSLLQTSLTSLVGSLGSAPPELQAALAPAVQAFKAAFPKEFNNPEYVQQTFQPAAAGAVLLGLLSLRRGKLEWLEELPRTYDYDLIEAYWQRRPLQLAWRFLSTGVQVGYYIACLQLDEWQDKLEANRPERAVQARELITNLGVTFIKVAQIWASRPDILPEEYIKEYLKLLEQVRPFGRELALETLQRSYKDGKGALDLFPDISVFDAPIASASVGQVYKAELNGRTVAVKVQRPDARETSTLDLYVIRQAGMLGQLLPWERYARQSKSLVELIDLTAPTFITELDYEQEAANQVRFADTVKDCELIRDNIVVPEVLYSTREVLVQEWLDGVKLTEQGAAQKQAGRVVKLLLNSYMVQFLETGFLHGDPHPGNFILMNDGRLGILDYGLMTEITEDKRFAFIEFLMHLQAREYKETLNDLIRLEFFPERLAEDDEALEIIVPTLSNTLNTLFAEGGDLRKKSEQFKAQREEMQESGKLEALREKLQVVSKRYQGAFKLPPYFTLILRAFSTLEGLGLKADSNFAVAKECFPYIARRLVTDDSFRMREALRSFLYRGRSRIAVSRIDELSDGFSSFTNLMKGRKDEAISAGAPLMPAEVNGTQPQAHDSAASRPASASASTDPASTEPAVLDTAARDVAVVLFSPSGNFLQDILIDEAVAAIDAINRAVIVSLLRSLGPLALPVSLPLSIILGQNVQQSSNTILTREDKEALLLLRRVVSLVLQGATERGEGEAVEAPTRASVQDAVRDFQNMQRLSDGLLPAVAPGAQAFARRFLQQLARRLLLRVADDVERRTRAGGLPATATS